jgi:DNA-binding transcriptional MerR regulator
MADQYSIRDLEEMSGVPADTIRTWERRYQLFAPTRDAGNARCYFADDIAYLHQLVILLKQGHRISALARMSRSEISALAQESTLTAKDSDTTETLCLTLEEFDATKLEGMMNCFIRKEGFDQAIYNRFVPFIEQISFLLLTGVLQPVHVQMFYATLRQKIHTAIDSIVPSREGARWILVHNDDILDTIHRDILHYLLRKGGKQVIVGGATSAEGMRLLVQSVQPDGHCLVAVGEHSNDWLLKMLATTPVRKGNTLVFIPGKTLQFVNNTQIEHVRILKGLPEAFQFLSGV